MDRTNFPSLAVDAYLLQAINGGTLGDRDFILRMEATLLTRLYRRGEPVLTIDDLNSYRRMLLHRVARYYGLERLADSAQRTVTVFKAPNGQERVPLKLSDMVEPEALEPPSEECKGGAVEGGGPEGRSKDGNGASSITTVKRMVIMRRSTRQAEPVGRAHPPSGPPPSLTSSTQRSLEERERAYEEARARIFKGHSDSSDNTAQDEAPAEGEQRPRQPQSSLPTSPSYMVTAERGQLARDRQTTSSIHFEGWKDLDAIRPFIPASVVSATSVTAAAVTNIPSSGSSSSSSSSPSPPPPPPSSLSSLLPQDAPNCGSIWVPQHIFVLEHVPMDDPGALKKLKALCRRHHCKLVTSASDTSRALLLFSYQVGKSEEELESLLGRPCARWRPLYLPEPPI